MLRFSGRDGCCSTRDLSQRLKPNHNGIAMPARVNPCSPLKNSGVFPPVLARSLLTWHAVWNQRHATRPLPGSLEDRMRDPGTQSDNSLLTRAERATVLSVD